MAKHSAAPFDHQTFLANLSTRPGVYQMLGADGEVLYVGKAIKMQKKRP